MKKVSWFAHPWVSILLAASWLLLQHSLAPFHLLSAALIGLIVPRLLHGFLRLLGQLVKPEWHCCFPFCLRSPKK